ncbi:MAG TPA: hypothetical protein VFZ58_01740 [Candidatus Saccharimonadales bacterium]
MAIDDETLDTVRKVLTGEISRSALVKMPIRPQTYAAVALIFARRSEFLERDNILRQRYLQVLYRLLVQGLPEIRHADSYTRFSFKEHLHQTKDGQTCLTPPTELLELVIEHGYNPAVEQFFEDAAQSRREQWFQEMQKNAAWGEPVSYFSRLVADLEGRGGIPALVALRAAIQARLDGYFEEVDAAKRNC